MKERALLPRKQHKLYSIWKGIRKRCNNPKAKEFPLYGGRGITVDIRWNSFDNFLADMEEEYREGLWIDRINNDLGYSKENCRWATPKQQQNNRRNNVRIEYKGEKHTLVEWAKKLNINHSTLAMRFYNYHWDTDKLFVSPKYDKGKPAQAT